jgi:hypothetical protein
MGNSGRRVAREGLSKPTVVNGDRRGFSKKLEQHENAPALYFMFYNFARIHQTLRVTPAMEFGVSDQVWNSEEIVGLTD